jgi:hypothetical protein
VPVQSIVKQCARAAGCTMSIIAYTRSFPCTPILHRSRMSGSKKIAPAAKVSSSKYYICYVPGPTCRGSVALYVPPLVIKGEACNVTESRLEGGVNRRNLKFTNLNTHYKPGLALELNSSLRERETNHQRNKVDEYGDLFYRGSVLANLLPVDVVTKNGSLSTLSLTRTVT